jgi:hypothetical protein
LGETALMYAVKFFNEYDLVPKILFNEAKIADHQGHTALYYAIKLGKKDIAK